MDVLFYTFLARMGIKRYSFSLFSRAVAKLAQKKMKSLVLELLDTWPDYDNSSFKLFRADVLFMLGDTTQAALLYENLINLFREGEDGDFVVWYRIEQLRSSGEYDKAIQLIQEFDKTKYKKQLTVAFFFNAAVCFDSKSETKKAFAYYKKALDCADIDIKTAHRIWFNLGALYSNVEKDYEQARQCYSLAYDNSTNRRERSKSLLGIGVSEFSLGRRPDGLKTIRKSAFMGNRNAFKVMNSIVKKVYTK